MAGHDDEFDFLVAVARRAIADLRLAGAGVNERRAVPLAEHLEETLAAIEGRIADSEQRLRQNPDPLDWQMSAASLRAINGMLAYMQEAQGYIAYGVSPRLHLGAIYFIDQATEDLSDKRLDVITVPEGAYGYATVSWPFNDLLEDLKLPLGGGERPVIIFYPPLEERAILLQALFMHELGHPTVEEHDLAAKVQSRGGMQFSNDRDQAIKDLAIAEGVPDRVAEETVDTLLEDWITELLCDSLALHYTGPSYLLAFAAVVAATSSAEVEETHPPTALRIKLLLGQLPDLDWEKFLEQRLPQVKAWMEYAASAAIQANSGLEAFALKAADALVDQVVGVARERLDKKVYDAGAFTPIESELRELLEERVLPAQLQSNDAVDRRSILLAGWLYLLRTDRVTDIASALADAEFQDFLTTALEMSYVLETWRSL